ncbi:MAG TPA: hypothetical protein ENI53_00670 [Thermoplasmatales archaeon]|nr:hypothetical protein [Thermoplasmatales archaeon]
MKNKKICLAVIMFFVFHSLSGSIINADENSIIQISYKFKEPVLKEVANGYRIKIDGCNLHEYNGLIVPAKTVRILLPYGKEIEKIKVSGKRKFLGNYEIEKEKPLFVGNKKVVPMAKNSIERLYEKVGVYGLRGYNILVMNILPVSYENGKVFYCEKIDVEIFLKKGRTNNLYRGFERDRNWVKSYIDNDWTLDTYPQQENSEKYRYLIITSEEFKNAFQKFADYKESKGIKTKVVTVEKIIGNSSFWNSVPLFNDTQAKIRNFIRYAYLNWGIDYVLLGGDGDAENDTSNIIPPRYLYATSVGLPLHDGEVLEAYIPSDVYYACLDGNFNEDMDDKWGENYSGNDLYEEDEADLYAEVWVGRACADSIEEINNFINKTISYEETDDEYLIQILLLGEYLGFGGDAEWGGNHKDKIVPLIPSSYNITKMYDREKEWDKYTLIPILNNGVHIVNHDGHGWTTYALKMGNTDLRRLKNTKYFILYSQTCLAGSFDNWYPQDRYYEDDCFAEHLTLDEYGAFACIMNARYGLGRENSTDSPGERYDFSFFEALFQEKIKEIGRANHYSKEVNVWRINENGMRWTYYQTNLFGDPEVPIKEPEDVVTINISMNKPVNGIYLFDRIHLFPLMNKTIVIGSITIEAEAETNPPGKIERINFYVNGELKKSLTNEPYKWKWNERAFGKYRIEVRACAVNGKCEKVDREIFIINS